MRWLVIGLLLGATVSRADVSESPLDETSPWHFGGGLGLTIEYVRDPNPEFGEYHLLPSVFGLARRRNLAVLVEGRRASPRVTSSGGLTVETREYALGTWVRYYFGRLYLAEVFATGGVGARFDTVRTTFGDASDERSGSRRFGGAGVGLSRTAWTRVLLETEARVLGREAARTPDLTFDLRLGVTF